MEKIGKYNIIEELGSGAMGVVYKAEDPVIGRTVAIKTIRTDYLKGKSGQDEALKRFVREAQSAGNLSHPNIITIHDINEDDGMMYIVMEFIEGSSLEDLISSGRIFSVDETLWIISQVADALDYAHSKGVIHRDIKPANILIDNDGKPRIVDFGIARISTSTLTQADTALGTPYYMAPEQIAGKKIDGRSDLFSLGAVVYEMLTDVKPFAGDNITTIIYKIVNELPPAVRTLNRSLPDGLDYILNKAMAKTPEERYQTGRELVENLPRYPEYAGLEAGPSSLDQTTVVPSVPIEPAPSGTRTGNRVVTPPARSGTLTGTRLNFSSLLNRLGGGDRRRSMLFLIGAMLAVVAVVLVVLIVSSGPGGGNIVAGGGGAVKAAADPQLQEDFKDAIDLENTRDYLAAKVEFEKILTQQPAHREAYTHLMNVLFELGEIDEAEAASNRMIAADPGFALPLMALATVAEKRGDLQASLAHYRNYISRSPARGDEVDHANSRITEIEGQLKKAAVRTRMTNQLNQIRADIQAKRFQSAMQKIQPIQSNEPDNEEARKLFAQAVAGMARGQILSLVGSYQNSFGKPGIYSFLQNSTTREVHQRMKDAIDSFYKYYNIYKNEYSKIRIEFIYSNRGPSTKAKVSFHQKSLARTKAKNEERVAVNGTYEWTVEKINNRWVIQNIVYRPGK